MHLTEGLANSKSQSGRNSARGLLNNSKNELSQGEGQSLQILERQSQI